MRHLFAAALLLTATACASDPEPAPDEHGWQPKAAAPSARTEVAAGVLDERIWVVGGLTDAGASAEVAVYDPAADRWAGGPAIPEPRHHTAAAGDGERLWVVGGYTNDRAPTDTVWTLEKDAWTPGPALPEPRAAGALAWDGERLVYAGGVGPGGLAGDVFVARRTTSGSASAGSARPASTWPPRPTATAPPGSSPGAPAGSRPTSPRSTS